MSANGGGEVRAVRIPTADELFPGVLGADQIPAVGTAAEVFAMVPTRAPPAATRAAAKQRRRRARQREGKIVLSITVCEVEVVEALISSRLLDPAHVDDRAQVERAV